MVFYESRTWKRKRNVILKRDNYMCQYSLREGRMVPANTVHHLFPLDRYPQYRLADWNLISLSQTAHELMHNRFDGSLSKVGRRWQMEAALMNGIKMRTTILIIGLPGSGKSTEAKRRLGTGICYDMDAISAAFRLTVPHADDHAGAKDFAADFFQPFMSRAGDYADRILIIRTAPLVAELEAIKPDEIVICKGKHDISKRKDYAGLRGFDWEGKAKRIDEAKAWAIANGIEVEEVE